MFSKLIFKRIVLNFGNQYILPALNHCFPDIILQADCINNHNHDHLHWNLEDSAHHHHHHHYRHHNSNLEHGARGGGPGEKGVADQSPALHISISLLTVFYVYHCYHQHHCQHHHHYHHYRSKCFVYDMCINRAKGTLLHTMEVVKTECRNAQQPGTEGGKS